MVQKFCKQHFHLWFCQSSPPCILDINGRTAKHPFFCSCICFSPSLLFFLQFAWHTRGTGVAWWLSAVCPSSRELLHVPLVCAGYSLCLVVLTPNCLTLFLASSLLYCQKCDLIFRHIFHFLYVSPSELLLHKVALLMYFPTQDCANNIFPMPLKKLSMLWLEREIAISWCSTTYKRFSLLSVAITLLSLDFV